MPFPLKLWRTLDADPEKVARLADQLELASPVATALVARGFSSAEDAETFLSPRLMALSDPFDLPGMREAVERIMRALRDDEPIVVFGDFDADGVTATAVLTGILTDLGASHVHPFLPDRHAEGYGFSEAALARCLERHQDTRLIVTVDCGVGASETVAAARAAGCDVIVTDHHELSGPVPSEAVAVVNPKLNEDPALHSLAGVGVAFKLGHALHKAGREAGTIGPDVPDLRRWLSTVALGTVADVVPLVNENRILVAMGLKWLTRRPSVGLQALMARAGVSGRLVARHLGFGLGPRINAAGRMGSAEPALELLLTADSERARALAVALEQANAERRHVEREIFEAAREQASASFDPSCDCGLVVYGEGWHVGTIGIVASRLADLYQRPTFVVAFDEDGAGRGSGRSVEGMDLLEILTPCDDLLLSYGGHRAAAGLSLKREVLETFQQRFLESCRRHVDGRIPQPVADVTAWLSPADIDWPLWEQTQRLAPFGQGNRSPLWGLKGVDLVGRPRRIGANGTHMKLRVNVEGRVLEAIGFNLRAIDVPEGPLDLLFELHRNEFRGQTSLQLQLVDLRAAE